jgi:aspartyl-tRNA(Asn)/glutamyl-tRNA(Gln) amidotransferase subunit B
VSERMIEAAQRHLDEVLTPRRKQASYVEAHGAGGLTAYDAAILTQSRDMAAYFDDVVKRLAGGAKLAANWITGELAGALNRGALEITHSPVSSAQLAGLLSRVRDGTVSGKTAKEIFDAIWSGEENGNEGAVDAIIERRGLRQISDSGELEAIVAQVIAANPKSVEEYRAGKEKAFNALVGQAMKATRGKGNPAAINDLLKKKLS